MQMTGTFPALNSSQGRNPATSRLGTPAVDRSVARVQAPTPIAPPKKRRLLVQPQGRAQNPMGTLAQNPALAQMVGNALNGPKNTI